jgi:C-methyltransferase
MSRQLRSSAPCARLRGPGGPCCWEQVIPTHDREFLGKWADLEMLLCLAARERTADEYRDLLARAGLRLTRVVQTAAPFSLVEAKPS